MIRRCKLQKYDIYYIKPRLLHFENESLISDEDITHLFLGFVRLMKKSIELDIESKYLNKIKRLEQQLKQARQN